jgi:large subunit ribosomal protein L3
MYSTAKGVPKGKKQAGHYGNEKVTIQGLPLVKVDADRNLLLIKGAVPGPNGGYLVIRKSLKDR